MHARRWLVLLQANLLFLTLAAHVMLYAMVPGLAVTASSLAVLLGQALRTYAPPHGTVPTWLAMGSAALPVAIASAMAIGGVLLPSPPWWLAALGLVPALGLIPPCLCARETEAAIFVGWALVVRSCGYRLLLRNPSIPK